MTMEMKKIIYYAFMVMGALAMTSCIIEKEDYGGIELTVGDELPPFEIEMNDGKIMTRDSLRGKNSMIVFFNTDCPDCRKELPVLQIFWERYREYVAMVCISREEKSDKIEKYWKENGLTLPYSAQQDRTIYNLFARTSIPRIYEVGENLIIRRIYTDNPLATLEELETDYGF